MEDLSYIWAGLDETDPFNNKREAAEYIAAMYDLDHDTAFDYVEEYLADPDKQDRSEPILDWPG